MGDEKKRDGAGMSRRTFALGVGGGCALLAMGALKVVPAEAQVRPPGGQDEERLIAGCIRCERCVEACPRGALRPAHLEDGIVTVRTPTANFNDGWCDFCDEENGGTPLCVEACPTEALSLPADAEAKTTIIGKAVLIRDWCLAWYRDNGCRFCFDACPYEAIELDQYNRPVVKAENCNGCGACQSVCVSQQEGSYAVGATSRAIIVVPESEA
ncbi:4Fe-4S dicluster domain-containing protein [Adlercreutzia sp. R25]|uniref:4Fe-4S dicluster domain-containing protein n=1 Tax=Adlercreutzia shanghongiae TaxID=3111773 RepID=UPI002DBD08AE|nr:4Fe-4S dicluster domain-containing protein [Adlercreutzia sp. R25]MEC4272112.1 4Fe-4S dicluster domain-containing protein [Adlercreutzia sp. R25]